MTLISSRRSSTKATIVLAAAASLILAGWTVAFPGSEPAHAADPQTFVYTGAPQLYVVPDGVTSIDVTLRGAQGGSVGAGVGGNGAVVDASIAVTPGESLQINVGGAGDIGGWNGGGRGVDYGGGASDIRRPSFSTSTSCAFDLNCNLNARAVVAGGGGGGSSYAWASVLHHVSGGAAGATSSDGSFENWTEGTVGNFTHGGRGASATAGGASGDGTGSTQGPSGGNFGGGGESGYGQGGIAGGGGGGGYFGGGAGGQSANSSSAPNGLGGGGGGSSWYGGAGVSDGSVAGGNTGDGTVTVSVQSAIGNAAVGFSGAAKTYTVPAEVDQLYVKLYGAAGGASGDTVWGRIPVTAGQALQLNIGGRGTGTADTSGVFVGGWNGGGDSTPGWSGSGSSGGGGSDLRMCASAQTLGCDLSDRVIVAGGGGGHYVGGWGLWGGNGGGNVNGDGASAGNPGHHTLPAGGGTLTAGGAGSDGGATPNPAYDGALGVGGDAVTGAGGGGGYYGGGGSNGSGAGGGSSYASVTGAGGASLLGTGSTLFRHARGGGDGDGLAVIVGMPQAQTGAATLSSYTAAAVAGQANPRYLATTPTVFYGTNATAVADNTSASVPIAGPGGAATIAGTGMQSVGGDLTGLSAGTWYYTVCSQSVAGYACGDVASFVVPALGAPLWTDQDASISVEVGAPFIPFTFVATGDATIVYTVTGTLPAGLTLDPDTGELSGTPTTIGDFTFTVVATNTAGSSQSVINTISILPVAPAIATTTLPAPTLGVAYDTTVEATGTGPLVFSVASGALPAGLSLDTATGRITGTPTTIGPATFSIDVTGPGGTASQPFTIEVGGVAPAITTTALAQTFVGLPYNQAVQATGTGPLSFAVSSGALPAGLTLDPATGQITGTPTTLGTATFTVSVTGPGGVAFRSFTIAVNPEDASLLLDATAGATLVVDAVVRASAQGLRPGTAWTLVVQSDPITLASGVAPASGLVATEAGLPSLAAGTHEVFFSGTHLVGGAFTLRTWFLVNGAGEIAAVTDSAAVAAGWATRAPGLASSGSEFSVTALVLGSSLIGLGALALWSRSRRRLI